MIPYDILFCFVFSPCVILLTLRRMLSLFCGVDVRIVPAVRLYALHSLQYPLLVLLSSEIFPPMVITFFVLGFLVALSIALESRVSLMITNTNVPRISLSLHDNKDSCPDVYVLVRGALCCCFFPSEK